MEEPPTLEMEQKRHLSIYELYHVISVKVDVIARRLGWIRGFENAGEPRRRLRTMQSETVGSGASNLATLGAEQIYNGIGARLYQTQSILQSWMCPLPGLTHDKLPENLIWFHESQKEPGLRIIVQYIQKPWQHCSNLYLPLFATTMFLYVSTLLKLNMPLPRAGVLMQHTWMVCRT